MPRYARDGARGWDEWESNADELQISAIDIETYIRDPTLRKEESCI